MNHLQFTYSLLLFLVFILGIPGYSQNTEADSLRNIINAYNTDSSIEDTTLVNTLIELSTFYRFSDMDSTLKYANLAASEAINADFTKGKLNARYLQAIVYYNRGDYERTAEIARQSLGEAGSEQFKQERALLNQLIGISYSARGSYQPGLSYFFEAYDLFKELGNDLGTFQNLNNIGVSYLKLEDYEEALAIFSELDSLRSLEPSTISIPVNLGFIYYELDQLEKAEQQLMRVINFDGSDFDQRAIGLSTFKLGEIHLRWRNYSKALDYFNRSIDKYEELGNELEKVQSLNGIARSYLQQGALNQALRFGNNAFKIANELGGLPEKNMSAGTLYEIHKAHGNFENALSYHEIYKNLSDSLSNDEINREVGRLEAEYEFREKELQMREAQQQQNLENASRVANRNILILISLSLLFIAVIVAYAQYRNSALRKKANDLLREKNDHIEQQAVRLEEMNDIKMHLFSIIAHDLRGPLSSLYGFITLNQMNELSKEKIQELIPELSDKFRYTSNLLNNLLNWAKSQLEGYRVIPEEFNLRQLLVENQKLLDYQAKEKNITVKNNTDDETVYADKNMISLVLLNLLSNAIKFTPENGSIALWTETKEHHIQFSIRDTGVGIPEDKLTLLFEESSFYTTDGTNNEKGTGLGLMLCKDFIKKNHGKFWAVSEVGKGSTFNFTVPKTKTAFKK
ncbi:ATP-binding protein [Gracilimonas sp.]|uniref:ATP-binding protein n=1 Tax=Gracilimonas sp. TaxID=1974203 RepID=UPI0032EACA75